MRYETHITAYMHSVAAVELHVPIFYTHYDSYAYHLLIFYLYLSASSFTSGAGLVVVIAITLSVRFCAAWWLACWLSGLFSSCWLLVACGSGLAFMGCCWVSCLKITGESGCLSRATPQHFPSMPVKGGKGNETYPFMPLFCFALFVDRIIYLLFSFHGAQEFYYKVKSNQQQTTTL